MQRNVSIFMALDDSEARTLAREEALAELARRYFTSHGPATVQDFGWWSGLPAADARAAVESVQPELVSESTNDQTYWMSPAKLPARAESPLVYLLPGFDEFLVSYRDRSAALDDRHAKTWNRGGGMLNPTMVIDGQVVGLWKRTFKTETVMVALTPFAPLTPVEDQAIAAAARRFGEFLGMTVAFT
jgi:hypothetical protein